jgi:hypothetical protein
MRTWMHWSIGFLMLTVALIAAESRPGETSTVRSELPASTGVVVDDGVPF